MPYVASIASKPADPGNWPKDPYRRVAVERAVLVAGRGLAGDAKARRGGRQLNVMLAEVVARLAAEGFRTAPGELGEQLVIAGLPAGAAAPGMRLRVGESAVIELGEPRVPCRRFARAQGRPAEAARGRVGFMARVLAGGAIAVGSPVMVEPAAATAPKG